MSKGMQEKLQLILVMSRDAELYILDEPKRLYIRYNSFKF